MSRRGPIKVLMMSMHLPPDFGGGGEQMLRLAGALAGKGVQCALIAGTTDKSAAGASSGNPSITRFYTPGKMKIRNFHFLIKSLWWILVKGRSFDILHLTSMNWAALAAILIISLYGKKTILKFSLMGVDDPLTIKKSSLGALKYKILLRLDRYVSTSSELVDELKAAAPEFAEKVALIRNGVDAEKFYPASPEEKSALRRELGLPESAVVFCFSGVVNRRKGIDALAKAWGEFSKNKNALLAIVGPVNIDGKRGEKSAEHISALGSTPEYVAEVRKIIADANCEESVIFTGAAGDVRKWLAATDVFVFPSRREGQPNAPAEAMACGLPVIATDIPGCRDLVENGINGYLAPVDDSAAFAARMEELFENPELRARLGSESIKIISGEFSMDSVAEKYIQMYESLITGGGK